MSSAFDRISSNFYRLYNLFSNILNTYAINQIWSNVSNQGNRCIVLKVKLYYKTLQFLKSSCQFPLSFLFD